MSQYTIEPPSRLYRVRPGLITALGVACIVVGVVSAFASGCTAVYGMGTLVYVKTLTSYAGSAVYGSVAVPGAPGMTPPPPPIMATPSSGGAPMPATPLNPAPTTPSLPPGIPSAEVRRKIVIDVVEQHRLTVSRQEQLDHLLAEVGTGLGFNFKADGMPLNIRRDLSNFGKVPGTQPNDPDVDFIATPLGRIELTDDFATFATPDGLVGYKTSVGTTGVSPVHSAWTLTPAEVQQVLDDAKRSSANRLNAAQLQSLRGALEATNQRLAQPGSGGMNWVQTTFDPSGAATVTINGSSLVIAQQGAVVSAGSGMVPFAMTASTISTVSLEGAAMSAFEGGLSVALAIYLFVTGILMLRQLPVAPRLLNLYVWMKLPLAILAGIGLTKLMGSYGTNMMTPASPDDESTAMTWGVAMSIAGLAFPAAAWLVLHSAGFREYRAGTRVE